MRWERALEFAILPALRTPIDHLCAVFEVRQEFTAVRGVLPTVRDCGDPNAEKQKMPEMQLLKFIQFRVLQSMRRTFRFLTQAGCRE
jgi:hypothetical protein